MPSNNKVSKHISNTNLAEDNHSWLLTIAIILILMGWGIFFFVGFWKIPSFLMQSLYLFVLPVVTVIGLIWIAKSQNEMEKYKKGIPLSMTIILWLWAIFSSWVFDLPNYVGIRIAINQLLWLSVIVMILGFGAGLLIQMGINTFRDHPIHSWLTIEGLFFVIGTLFYSLCFPIVFWAIGAFASG